MSRSTSETPVDLMGALEESLRPAQRRLDRWEAIKTGATLSAIPPGVFTASIVWGGESYTGSGGTSDAALRDLQRQIEETRA